MTVKWHGLTSSVQTLAGGGPQGCTFGLLEYKSTSNNNADHVSPDMRFKFVDDLSTLEKLNLILLGLSSYNFKNHVASNVGINQKYLSNKNIESQNHLNKIEEWTNTNKTKLNVKKSHVMIFNFTKDFQFSTRLYLEDTLLEIINETKLLGIILSSDLKWHQNTDMLVKKGFQRMLILHKLISFNVNYTELVNIYILYIRSVLELNCQVWHYTISEEEVSDLERVQKVACKIILQDDYTSYEEALNDLDLQPLRERRDQMCLNFAKRCVKHPKAEHLFPLNTDDKDRDTYKVQFAKRGRLLKRSIPQNQRALNADVSKAL